MCIAAKVGKAVDLARKALSDGKVCVYVELLGMLCICCLIVLYVCPHELYV